MAFNLGDIRIQGAIAVVVVAASSVYVYIMFRKMFRTAPPKLLQDPDTKYEVKLIEKEAVSHDTRRFRFDLPSKDHVLGLPCGQHIYLSAQVNGQLVIRPYTPVSSDDNKGYFELVVKVYFKDKHPRFPDGGKLSQYLESLKIGDTIHVRGPSGLLIYNGKGNFAIKPDKKSEPKKRKFSKLGMVAGGTGITPMLQIIQEVLKHNDQDKTTISLLFANQSENDILLRKELDDLSATYPNQFKVWYTIDKALEGWKYSTGFVSADLVKKHLPEPSEDSVILLCGPPPMVKFVHTHLDALEYSKENRFQF